MNPGTVEWLAETPASFISTQLPLETCIALKDLARRVLELERPHEQDVNDHGEYEAICRDCGKPWPCPRAA